MIRKASDFRLEQRAVGGSNDILSFRHGLEKEESFDKFRLCAEITLEPGQAVGEHSHDIEAEIYYMLSGELVSINEDKSEEPFCPGDIMLTSGGSKHAVRNNSDKKAVMLAIVIN